MGEEPSPIRYEAQGVVSPGRSGWRRWVTFAIGPALLFGLGAGPLPFFLAVGLSFVAYALLARSTAGRLAISGKGLLLDGELLFARDRVQCAYVADEQPDVVRVLGPRGVLGRVRLATGADARGLTQALTDLKRSTRACYRIKFHSPLKGFAVLSSGYLAACLVTAFGVMCFDALAGFLAGVAVLSTTVAVGFHMLLSYGSLEVGDDGILIRAWWGSSYEPYGAVKNVRNDQGRIALALTRRGQKERLYFLPIFNGEDEHHACKAVVARIAGARAGLEAKQSDRRAAALLAPLGRPSGQWLREVRGLLRAPGYREQSVEAERLWRVVEDPGAPRETRAAAALALAGDDAWVVRVRVAADGCADPALRKAFARIAERQGEDEEEEAMEALVGPTRHTG